MEHVDPACPRLVLASASPRRRALLAQLGIACRVQAACVDETAHPGESAGAHALRLAGDKARAVGEDGSMGLPVLAADTVVEVDGRLLHKPADRAAGLAMLALLSGRIHRVHTGVCLLAGGRLRSRLSVSTVWFRRLSADEMRAYWDTGEPRDKAGGYAVQGRGAAFIRRLEGSYSGVMGLPLYETAELLREAGIELFA
ncbi:MAG TPA: septum formation inhibitor Maf [Gammaproteobacteria bacterium]|nr:septum formation inhibitor Maf [Gammaproteobacteria bacterium]